MTKTAQPYTEEDLEHATEIVMELHGLSGFDAWADHIAKALAEERKRALTGHMG